MQGAILRVSRSAGHTPTREWSCLGASVLPMRGDGSERLGEVGTSQSLIRGAASLQHARHDASRPLRTSRCPARYMEVWKSARIELKPFVLAGVNAKTGNVAPFARPWAQSTMKEQLQHLRRNVEFFNVPGMLPMPANFFGPDGPADRRGLARDLRYQRLLVAVRRLHPERLWEVTGLVFDHIWASREARPEPSTEHQGRERSGVGKERGGGRRARRVAESRREADAERACRDALARQVAYGRWAARPAEAWCGGVIWL